MFFCEIFFYDSEQEIDRKLQPLELKLTFAGKPILFASHTKIIIQLFEGIVNECPCEIKKKNSEKNQIWQLAHLPHCIAGNGWKVAPGVGSNYVHPIKFSMFSQLLCTVNLQTSYSNFTHFMLLPILLKII